MKPEKEQLIDDLLVAENRRVATLLAGAQILRRRRHWRAARRTFALLILATVAALWFKPKNQLQKPIQAPMVETKPAPVQAKVLTDDQLLALFPNTPVGLATLPNGKKLLIFPRPGDEAKFVIHL
jgi:hypothetical protein